MYNSEFDGSTQVKKKETSLIWEHCSIEIYVKIRVVLIFTLDTKIDSS